MNFYKPCLFFETSAPARAVHYLVSRHYLRGVDGLVFLLIAPLVESSERNAGPQMVAGAMNKNTIGQQK